MGAVGLGTAEPSTKRWRPGNTKHAVNSIRALSHMCAACWKVRNVARIGDLHLRDPFVVFCTCNTALRRWIDPSLKRSVSKCCVIGIKIRPIGKLRQGARGRMRGEHGLYPAFSFGTCPICGIFFVDTIHSDRTHAHDHTQNRPNRALSHRRRGRKNLFLVRLRAVGQSALLRWITQGHRHRSAKVHKRCQQEGVLLRLQDVCKRPAV